MKRILTPFFLAPLLWSAVADQRVEAVEHSAQPTRLEPGSFKVDTTHSACIFRVKHAGAAFFYGRFNHVEGELALDEDDLATAEVTIRVKADSVDTAVEGRDKHVRSPDFLDAAQFPWITFKGEEFERAGDNAFTVRGQLELRGVSKPIEMRVEHTGTGEFRGSTRVGYETTFAIKRSEFGSNYGIEAGALGDEVRLTFGLEMIKQ